MFKTLTKNAESVTVTSNGTRVALFGNGNKIVFRIESGSGYPATLELTFSEIWAKKRKIKFRHKNWQHAQMATHYREILARMLQGYDTGIAFADNQQPAQLYMDLAWEGLRYADIPTWNDLLQTEKDRVNDIISDYVNDNQNETCTE